MKTILFCGNGMSGEIIPVVRSWGYRVALITEFPGDRGVDQADYVAVAKSKNPQEALLAARKIWDSGFHFDGVMSLCWDCAISVSTIAAEFNLPGIPVEVAKRATYKDVRSELFSEHNISAPAFALCEDLRDLCIKAETIGYPIVLKPIDQSSSKGVVICEDRRQLEAAYSHCISFSLEAKVIVNQLIVGTEHSTEGLMIEGHLHPTGLTDRIFDYQKYRPFFVEIGDVMPSVLSESVIQRCYSVTECAAKALGIQCGPVKADLIISQPNEVFVLEIAARLGGPRFGTEMIPLGNGTCILRAAIQQALGDEVDVSLLRSTFNRGMVNRSIFPNPGRVVSIRGLAEAAALGGFYDFKWWRPEGLCAGALVEKPRYGCGDVGYIVATGKTREDALLATDRIENTIVIETAPL
ncbi:MAG: ATP-grasp domain-containing protein [Desulforhabdus sp.]|jgi:biotin carboxylase|nr:ATP-grasp domain-containing protein [Desulforhabdus sp.]